MYPTATRYPGPANANSLRQNPAPAGTAIDLWISGRLTDPTGSRQPLVPPRGELVVSGAMLYDFDHSKSYHSSGSFRRRSWYLTARRVRGADQSARKAINGSIRDARNEGSRHAAAATVTNSTATLA